MFIENHGNNTGLYCSMCGKWQKWLNKDEIRAFNQNHKVKKKKGVELEISELIKHIDSLLDTNVTRKSLNYEKTKNALLNIIAGRDWNDNGE